MLVKDVILINHNLDLSLLPPNHEYRVLKEFPDYALSDNGLVYSFLNPLNPRPLVPGLTNYRGKDGKKDYSKCYKTVNLRNDEARKKDKNKRICKQIHRLICKAFHDNPLNKPQVNHKDGDKFNNHKDNLEWVTPKENVIHALETGLTMPPVGEQKPNAKYTEELMRKVADEIRNGVSNIELVKKYGFDHRKVTKIRMMREWKHIWTDEERKNGPYMSKYFNGSKTTLEEKVSMLEKMDFSKTNVAIAKEFNLTAGNVSYIRLKKIWKEPWKIFLSNCNKCRTTIESISSDVKAEEKK